MLLVILMIFGAAIASLVALFTLLRNPSSSVHRWLFLLILAACCWVVSVNLHSVLDVGAAVWFLRFAFAAASCLGLAILRFCYAVSGVNLKTTAKVSFMLLALAGVAFSLSPWVIEGFSDGATSGVLEPMRGVAYPSVIIIILYPIIHGLVLLDSRRRHRTGVHRTQLWIVEIGLIIGAAVGILTNVILPNITKTTYPSRFAFLAIVVLTTSLVYAVVQHRFLDIRLAVARAVAYTTTLLTIAVLYVGAVLTLAQFVLSSLPVDHALRQFANVLVAIMVAVTFQPLKVFFDRVTNRIFYRDAYDTKEVLDAVGDVLVGEVRVESFVHQAGKILNHAMKANHLEVVLINSKDKNSQRRIVVGRSTADTSRLVKHLLRSHHKLVAVDELGDDGKLQQELIATDTAVATRLETSRELLGYVLVSYKSNGAAYTNQDMDLIRIVADELAVATQNALRFEEILHFNETLKQEIEEATAKLRDSNRKLKKLDEAKDEFISMASHQLRTPLTSVKGYISLVMEGDAGKLTEPQLKLLQEAFTAAQRMVYLIGDFLNVSRLKTGRFVLETKRTDIAQLVNDEVSHLNSTAVRRRITVNYQRPAQFPIVTIDANKMRQVIMNFIDNAIFYSKPSSLVDVVLLNTGKEIRFEVHDTGIGVPEAERHMLFTKFFRASNARRVRPDGTGIGLFMAKKVITAHGGSMILETKENKGSTFGFSLPIATLKH